MTHKKRKICVLTGNRAEYGLLRPVMEAIKKHPRLKLQLVVTGTHLLKKYGRSLYEIQKDGFNIDAIVPMYAFKDNEMDIGMAVGETITRLVPVFKRLKPDFLLVLGDRFEPFAAVIAAATLSIPIAHMHAGDKCVSGNIDESIRYAISRFAHIHFAASAQSAKRLKKTGEESWRVHLVGSTTIDNILSASVDDRDAIFGELKFDPGLSFVLCLEHPISIERYEAKKQMEETLKAINYFKLPTVIIYPNSDPGSEDIINVIERNRNKPWIRIFKNLSVEKYLALMKCSSVMIGNSSSGIIESPFFKLPVVNIGSRNSGRERAENVILTDNNHLNIIRAMKIALTDKKFLSRVKKCKNPYGKGRASGKITDILDRMEINKKLLAKQITY